MLPNDTAEVRIQMTEGLAGFEEVKEYALRPVPGNTLFFCLEAEGGPFFVLTRPESFFADFSLHVKREELKELCPLGNIAVYALITVPERVPDMTANLLAPLFVNEEKGLARQIIMHDSPYTTRHYLFPPERRRDCG